MSLPINLVIGTSTQALLVTSSPRYEEMMFEGRDELGKAVLSSMHMP
jgi:hypothetical protein